MRAESIKIKATDLNDAWFQTIYACVNEGFTYEIDTGSYAGQKRKQLYNATIEIDFPGTRPLAPQIPPGYGFPPPTNDEKIEKYFLDYLMNPNPQKNEQYTYGMYIAPQLPKAIEILKRGHGTNQACITVGDPKSIELADPPCLKLIDIKIAQEELYFTLYFRSWDLFCGFPENLGGLQMLKEFVVSELSNVRDGKIIAHSSGLHLYDHCWDLANIRLGKKEALPRD